VPLIIRGPDIPKRRKITETVSLVDLLPTVLELLALPPLAQVQGTSLREALVNGQPPPARPIFFEWIGKHAQGVRWDRWKVTERGAMRRTTLHDLIEDPLETDPIRGSHLAKAKGAQLLRDYRLDGEKRAAAMPLGAAANPYVIGEDTQRALRALGYTE
jgi:arylsulfatase A-like enzyme